MFCLLSLEWKIIRYALHNVIDLVERLVLICPLQPMAASFTDVVITWLILSHY